MSYRPICDVWLLARPKVPYYGAYPAGFLGRARALLGVNQFDAVLHVCSGKVKDYPYSGFSDTDRTVDIDPELQPDFVMDVRHQLPKEVEYGGWDAVLADPPYTEADAAHYICGASVLPDPNKLLRDCLAVVKPQGRVGMLHYLLPRPPKTAKLVATVAVIVGFNNRVRMYSVFERLD
jgi:hypothetical protein